MQCTSIRSLPHSAPQCPQDLHITTSPFRLVPMCSVQGASGGGAAEGNQWAGWWGAAHATADVTTPQLLQT